jgi:tRNA pseudouridine55 synthase
MNKLLTINKPLGKTPLQIIQQVKKTFSQYSTERISYAGRLDPLAHGVLLLMVGDAVLEREKYLNLPKTYEFEVLLGIETDTYDILGLIQQNNGAQNAKYVNLIVNTFVSSHVGKQIQSYPPYSSKPVNGKPLFWWAKENKLSEITIPTKEIEIYQFDLVRISEIQIKDLQSRVQEALASVQGEFRQKEIKKRWKEFFDQTAQTTFTTVTCTISCSSGTYVRELAHELGEEIGCRAIAIDILRTKIGDYELKDAKQIFNQ